MGTTLGKFLGTNLGTTAGGTQHTARSLVDRAWGTNQWRVSEWFGLDEVLGLVGLVDATRSWSSPAW